MPGRIDKMNNNKNIWQKTMPYIFTALLVTTLLILMAVILKIYPFGDKVYLWADADQYISFDRYFGSLTGKNDIFYSWENVLGGNALPQLAYYSFSPFNIIYIIMRNNVMHARTVVVYLKMLLSSLSMCFCLSYLYRDKKVFPKMLISTSYAFMGYLIFYGWNMSWMDGVILLPVMIVGLSKLINDENILLYVIVLAIAIISNFYIGYMLCIVSAIAYFSLILLSGNNFFKKVKTTLLKYIIVSIIAVGISGFILLPTILELPSGRRLSIYDTLKNMYIVIKPAEILSGLFTGQINELNSNAPLIYVGPVALCMMILFFTSRKIDGRRKIVFFAIIIIYVISFMNSFANKLWHGMSDNVWFNFRYSFTLSFIFVIIAYEILITIGKEGVCSKDCVIAFISFLFIVVYVVVNAGERINPIGIALDIIILSTIFALLFLKIHNYKIVNVVLLICTVVSTTLNMYTTLKDYDMVPISGYNYGKEIMEVVHAKISDDSFYRMDKSLMFGRCDGNLFNYNGVSNYASTENVDNLEFIKKLGVRHDWMWGAYTTNLPFATESLLGLKYVITDSINGKDYKEINSFDGVTLYKNQSAFPILFPVDHLGNFNIENINDFELLNIIWESINNRDEKVFNNNMIKVEPISERNSLKIYIQNDGSAYLGIPSGEYPNIVIDNSNEMLKYDPYSELYYMGEYERGDIVRLSMESDCKEEMLNNIICYTENSEAIKNNATLINNQDIEINEKSSSHLEIKYSGDSKHIATTIPYDAGWTVYDNDTRVDIEKNWNNFISFNLDSSNIHFIELIYRPVGYKEGLLISIISAVAFLIAEVGYIKRKKRITLKEVMD